MQDQIVTEVSRQRPKTCSFKDDDNKKYEGGGRGGGGVYGLKKTKKKFNIKRIEKCKVKINNSKTNMSIS